MRFMNSHLITFKMSNGDIVTLTNKSRAGNMGRVRWAGSNWPDILEGRVVKLAARIKSGPIGPARIGPQPIRVRAEPTRLARNFFFNF